MELDKEHKPNVVDKPKIVMLSFEVINRNGLKLYLLSKRREKLFPLPTSNIKARKRLTFDR